MLKRLWSHRSLLWSLVRRQYQLRYRQSFVGFAWALVPPLATLGVGIVIFQEIAKVDTGREPYAVFTMAGLVPWTLFANSVTSGVPSIVSASNMVLKLRFPRAVIPLSIVGLSLLDLAVAVVGFAAVLVITGEGIAATAILAPLVLLVELPLIAGVVLLGSALNVFARDIRLAVPLLVQFWLLLTPVLYPLSGVPSALRDVYPFNPMTGIVESFRSLVLGGSLPDPFVVWSSVIGATALFLLGVWYFAVTESRFADVI